MPILQNIKLDSISASSVGLIEYGITEFYTNYRITGGSGTALVASQSIGLAAGETPFEGLTFYIHYEGDVIYSGSNVITVFGRTLTATEARNVLDITAVYTQGGWNTDVQYVKSQVTTQVAMTTGGGTYNANYDNVTDYLITGTGTLTSSFTFQPDPTLTEPSTPLTVRVLYDGQFALNGNNITIFGLALTTEQALKGRCIIEATFNPSPGAAAWVPVLIESSYDSPYLNEGVEDIAITAAGGIFTLNPKLNTITQNITGSDTLVGNVSVVPAAGTYRDGDRFEFFYKATMTAGAFATTIFGVSLNAAEMLAGDLYIVAVYDLSSTSWKTAKLRSPQYGQKELITIPLSFEANEIGKISLTVPYNFEINTLQQSISSTIGVNDGSIAIDIAGASTTPASVTVAANSTVGTSSSTSITSNNTGVLGQAINLTTSSATSGRTIAFLTLTRMDNI